MLSNILAKCPNIHVERGKACQHKRDIAQTYKNSIKAYVLGIRDDVENWFRQYEEAFNQYL